MDRSAEEGAWHGKEKLRKAKGRYRGELRRRRRIDLSLPSHSRTRNPNSRRTPISRTRTARSLFSLGNHACQITQHVSISRRRRRIITHLSLSLSLSLLLVHGTFLTEDRMAETDRKTAPHRLIIREHIPSPLFRFQYSAPTFVPP